MTVQRASDNPFPSVLFEEHVDPANPSAGTQRLFVDTDHVLKLVDSSGTVTTFGGAVTDATISTSDITTNNASTSKHGWLKKLDNNAAHFMDGTGAWSSPSSGFADPMTTRGDVIVRNASNVTARLAIGSSGKVLSSDGTDVSWQTPAAAGGFAQISTVKLTGSDLTTSSTSFVDATGLTVTMTTGAHRCLVTFIGNGKSGGGGTTLAVTLVVDGTNQGGTYGMSSTASSSDALPVGFTFWTDVLSAASHTIKIQFRNDSGSTANLQSGNKPLFFQVAETTLAT